MSTMESKARASVLAVDGGNTKTLALVAALDGTILGRGRSGCSDIYNTFSMASYGQEALDLALANLEQAINDALDAARVKAQDLLVGVFNLAGADWPEDFALLRAAMQTRGFGQTIIVQNDAFGVLHTGHADPMGVSILCGTGAAVGARGPGGRSWHASYWLDTGGSIDLGRKTLELVYRSALGLAAPTTLTGRVLDLFQVETVEDVLHRLTGRETRKLHIRQIDRLAPALLDEAHAGDSLARGLVREHGNALGLYANVAARRVGLTDSAFPLVLAGGVLRHPSPLLADAIVEAVRAASPAVQPARAPFEPVVGVLFSALAAAGVQLDTRLAARVTGQFDGGSVREEMPLTERFTGDEA